MVCFLLAEACCLEELVFCWLAELALVFLAGESLAAFLVRVVAAGPPAVLARLAGRLEPACPLALLFPLVLADLVWAASACWAWLVADSRADFLCCWPAADEDLAFLFPFTPAACPAC